MVFMKSDGFSLKTITCPAYGFGQFFPVIMGTILEISITIVTKVKICYKNDSVACFLI